MEAIEFLEDEHKLVLDYYNIKQKALLEILKSNYQYLDEQHRTSQYLCVFQTILMVYFGQFYKKSFFYKELEINMNNVIVHKNKESQSWLQEKINLKKDLILKENTDSFIEDIKNSYFYISTGQSTLEKELDKIIFQDPLCRFTLKEKKLFVNSAIENIQSSSINKGNITYLCVIAQYVDNLGCFQDILRPKWYGKLDFPDLIPWQFGITLGN
ncbi:hypothetical protein ACLIX2_11495 [Proteus cibi]